MGGGHHKCCDTAVNHLASIAAVVHHPNLHHHSVVVAVLIGRTEAHWSQHTGDLSTFLSTVDLSPPGSSVVLRI